MSKIGFPLEGSLPIALLLSCIAATSAGCMPNGAEVAFYNAMERIDTLRVEKDGSAEFEIRVAIPKGAEGIVKEPYCAKYLAWFEAGQAASMGPGVTLKSFDLAMADGKRWGVAVFAIPRITDAQLTRLPYLRSVMNRSTTLIDSSASDTGILAAAFATRACRRNGFSPYMAFDLAEGLLTLRPLSGSFTASIAIPDEGVAVARRDQLFIRDMERLDWLISIMPENLARARGGVNRATAIETKSPLHRDDWFDCWMMARDCFKIEPGEGVRVAFQGLDATPQTGEITIWDCRPAWLDAARCESARQLVSIGLAPWLLPHAETLNRLFQSEDGGEAEKPGVYLRPIIAPPSPGATAPNAAVDSSPPKAPTK